MLRWLMLAMLLLICAVLLGREVLRIGEARREGRDPVGLYRRLRRRAKGLVVLVTLFVTGVFYEEIAGAMGLGPRERLLYFGAAVVLLFWLLILSARDLKETTEEALSERRQLTQETLRSIEEEIDKRRGEKRSRPRE